MADSARTSALLPGEVPSRAALARRWMRTTWPGRALAAGLAVKAVNAAVSAATGSLPPSLETLGSVGSLALLFGLGYLIARGLIWTKRHLLWRVRRKLILSYVFVGLVPSLLIAVFFLLGLLLLFFNISSYLVQTRMRATADQARFLAQATLLDVQRSTSPDAVRETLERRQASAEGRYPHVSMAIVPASARSCAEGSARAGRPLPVALPATVGPWQHLSAPLSVPAWVPCDGFAGLLAYEAGATPGSDTRLVFRAVTLPEAQNPTWAVVVDLPVSQAVERQLRDDTGIQLGEISAVASGENAVRPVRGTALDVRAPLEQGDAVTDRLGAQWVTFLDYQDWESGRTGSVTLQIGLRIWEIYGRISTVPSSRLGVVNFGQLLIYLLLIVGVLFLVIQAVALVLGLVLARQITGAVHDLFTGTQHLRNGDFSHQIPVRARDQLGELAESFNDMTGEVTRLLGQVAQKERAEQELLTAREIQMKLLPQGPLVVPGLAMTTYCEPAREVGGDYYDFFPIGPRAFGVLIADVSGKGVGAGMYMAQLKGLVLSLEHLHASPRDLLVAVNRVLARHMDGTSYITMTYLVVDLDRRVATYARAGHTPLIYLPGPRAGVVPQARVLAPDGLVVGLKVDEDGTLFESLLQEVTLPLGAGDLIVLFTDGISEAMNEAYDCFGEARLGAIVERDGLLTSDGLGSRILDEVRSFAAGAPQHDDMTLILMKVEAAAGPPALP
jgi:sigma-B regulation protein RsbU (phosphoserine phosphatase)